MADPVLLLAAAAAVNPPAALDLSLPAEVAAAVGTCWRAVGASGVDRQRLTGEGWSLVEAPADPTTSTLDVFAKPGANHRILLVKESDPKPLCTVIARLSSLDDARSTLGDVQKTLQSFGTKVPASSLDDGIAFTSLPRIALVDLTDAAGGTQEHPALRVVVSYHIAEQK